MEGPTPVSALIHAATMVTAGVYLIARMWPFYSLAPDISDLVAIVGVATLTLAGLIALVQTDIKRVIAYSTMSQIGYMFCAVGLGAYSSGMFLLVMHAFFKALLFLGAGVVIHALGDEQDMRKMGGMGRYLPYSAGLMWIGALALAGVPPFSGFFAKDQILADALARGDWVGYVVWGLGLAGAFVTALYTFRLMLLVFHGEPSEYAREHGEAHAGHGEGPFSMLWTISILAVGTTFAGFLEIPQVTHGMRNFLAPTIPSQLEATGNQDLGSSALAVGFALIGLVAAFMLWGRRSETTRRIAARPRRSSGCCRRSSASTGSTTGPSTGPPPRLPAAAGGSGSNAPWSAAWTPSAAPAPGGAACSRARSPVSCASTPSQSRSA
jgi:NADH-quinone oxidoreductase subunit L